MRISDWSSDVCSSDLAATGAAILSRLQEPVDYEGRVLNATASLGGASFPADASSASELFNNADIALYALKGSGRGGTKMFQPPLRDQARIVRSEEHTSELQSLMRISYAVFCLKKKK